MGSILFIVWRESIEAVLVIGILLTCLNRLGAGRAARAWLWAGVAGGLALSGALATATMLVQDELQGRALQWFQTGMMFAAAALLTQMVLWMQRQGRKMKAGLEADLTRAVARRQDIGAGLIALLAVAREGGETVLYVYGVGTGQSATSVALAVAAGVALALLTAWLVSRGARYLDYRVFFRVTGALLLLSASGLIVSGVASLCGMGVLPGLIDPVWHSAWLLDSGSGLGAIIATLTGYRSSPSLTMVLAWVAYWATVCWLTRRRQPAPAPAAA